ncbi:MAG: Spy/CpxP family protein refolding chaperone [Kofleriaceae bacterium]
MNRIRTFVTIMLPSMIAGGLLFGAAFSHAASNESDGFWPNPAPVVIAQADPPKKPGPPPPPPKNVPPPPPVSKPGGFSVSIDHGAVQVTGIRELVKGQLVAARAAISGNPHIPADTKRKLLARIDKVGTTVDKRLANLKLSDLDQLDDELEKMGEELEDALEGLDEDLEKLGDSIGKNIKIDLGKLHFDHDDDDDFDFDIPSAPDVGDTDDDDMRDAINDLKDLALDAKQRDQITKLRTDSDKEVAASKKQIAELSEKLRTSLGNPGVTDADITRLVDQISGHEAAMRKARILAWAKARRVLDAAQRKKVEDAAAKAKAKVKTK